MSTATEEKKRHSNLTAKQSWILMTALCDRREVICKESTPLSEIVVSLEKPMGGYKLTEQNVKSAMKHLGMWKDYIAAVRSSDEAKVAKKARGIGAYHQRLSRMEAAIRKVAGEFGIDVTAELGQQ